MRLVLALAVIPAALADSDCDFQCRRMTGLISCGTLEDCHNRLADLQLCKCVFKWWIGFIIAIMILSLSASCAWSCVYWWKCCECGGETPKEKEKARKALEEARQLYARQQEDIVNGRLMTDGTLRQHPTLQNF